MPRTDDEVNVTDDLDDWDFEHAYVLDPVEAPGAVVSVRFDADDFERVARQSETEGISLIDFIRRAAVERADRPIHHPVEDRSQRRVG